MSIRLIPSKEASRKRQLRCVDLTKAYSGRPCGHSGGWTMTAVIESVVFPVDSHYSKANPGRYSKEGRGKRMARSSSSMAMEWIRDLCYDDYDESDWEWRPDSRFSRAKAAAAYQLRDLFDPNYGPWEEVHEDTDSMDLEDQEATDVSCASKRVDCEFQGVSSSYVLPKDRCGATVASCATSSNPGSTVKSVKVEEVDKGMGSYG